MKYKYPRTPHLPDSPGATQDDKILTSLDHLFGEQVVITEKMDGECTTIHRDYTHARSLDSNNHPSRNWLKGFWGQIRYKLPESIRICGENLYAQHSIPYSGLPSYFLAFNAWEGERCLPWDETKQLCGSLGISMVPELYRGDMPDRFSLFQNGSSVYGPIREGFVVRLASGFYLPDFPLSVAKWVRAQHVQTTQHWTQSAIIPNGLSK